VSAKKLISDLTFVIIDLETTGGNQSRDKIIEIGLVKITKLKVVDQRDFLINPKIPIPDFIQKLTTITPKDVEEQPCFEEVIDEVSQFIGDAILVAHNTAFDIPFLNSELKRANLPLLTNKSLCTNLMTKYLIPNILNSNLNYMSRIFNITHKKAHRAIDDALATADLLLIYLDIFISKKIPKINHLYYPKNRYELDRRTIAKGTRNHLQFLSNIQTPFLITIKGENGIILSAYPSSHSPNDIDYIKKQLKKLPWVSYTVKLFGDFLEAFSGFYPHFQKMQSEQKKDILDTLYKTHFDRPFTPQVKSVLSLEQERASEKRDLGDFIILPHLVPEQLLIYPLHTPQTRLQLTFRYPAHKKKLIQYINSKSARLDKIQKGRITSHIADFYYSYLHKRLQVDQGKSIMLCPKSIPQKEPEIFFKQLDEFLLNNIQSYRYPKEHI
jgi:DNA polymerase-3 subunit alpha (Gram-positive type)